MAVAFDTNAIKFSSGPFKMRPGLVPLCVALAMGYVYVAIWFTVACFVFSENLIWSILIMCSSLGFAVFLSIMTFCLYRDSQRRYELEVNGSELVLNVFDKVTGKDGKLMILLDDVSFAEYYPYPDTASLIFHTPYKNMEVPLWPLGERGQDVLDYLTGRGIKIVNVQSDERFPG